MIVAVVLLAWGAVGDLLPISDRLWFAVLFALPFIAQRR
jgi:hypothetical protein